MTTSLLNYGKFVGREIELNSMMKSLESALNYKGSTLIISGEPGIGKTRLVEEFKKQAASENVTFLTGAALSGTVNPFFIFSRALAGVSNEPLFEEQEHISFTEIFAVNSAGLLLAKASSEEGCIDADIFAGMLSAVQNFIKDSFDLAGESKAGLGRLEYGDMKIIIEHGEHLFLAAVFMGTEHPDMKNNISRALKEIENSNSLIMQNWSGRTEEMGSAKNIIKSLTQTKFLVKKTMEGVKLEKERARIAGKILEMLAQKSMNSPLLILLEDLHWADESSLFVLNYLARNVISHRILILGTARRIESPSLEKLLEKMKKENLASELCLKRLDNDSVCSIIGNAYLHHRFPDSFMQRLAKGCGGNPFFVIEMLRQMREDGIIRKENDGYILISQDYTIPDTVEDVVRRRLESLEPESMALAEFASCIGREFETKVVMSSPAIVNSENSLKGLLASGIVNLKNDRAEFSHALFQETIYKGITPRWKHLHHRGLGEYYEREHAHNPDEVIYDLARHFSKSNVFDKTFNYCLRAGEKAENAFAAELAIEFYNAALSVLPKMQFSENERIEEEVNINNRKGTVLQLIGNWPETEKLYARNIDIASQIKNERKLAESQNNMGRFLHLKGSYDKAKPLLEEAYGTFRNLDDKEGQIKSLNNLANIYIRRGENAKAMELYQQQLEISESIDHMDGIAMAEGSMAIVYFYMGDNVKSMESFERKLAIAQELKDKIMISHTTGNMGVIYQATGNLDKAIECYEKDFAIVTELGDKLGMNIALGNLGQVWLAKGDFGRAQDCFEKKLLLVNELGDKPGLKSALRDMSDIAYEQGDYSRALELALKHLALAEEMDDKQATGEALTGLAKIHHAIGKMELALDFTERAIELHRKTNMKQYLCENLAQKSHILCDMGREVDGKASIEEAARLAVECNRPEHIFFTSIIHARILSKIDAKSALTHLESMLQKSTDETELAWIHYEIHKLTGDADERKKALDLYLYLYEKTPRAFFKKRIDELK